MEKLCNFAHIQINNFLFEMGIIYVVNQKLSMIIDKNKLNELCLYKGQQVETKIQDLTNDQSPDFESDLYKVVYSISQKVNNKFYYYYILYCKKCGSLKKICKND